jgi:CRISPR-associated protein Csb2
MQLEVEVTFTSSRFHGDEWPPSPGRLFQAMVAATHRGAYALFNPQVRDDALRWLESLEPPVICACPAIRSRQRLVNYVPNNDNFLDHVRTDKSLTAYALPGSQAVMYRWSFPANPDARHHADVVSAMAALITYVGRTVDHVYARGTVRRDGQPPRRDGELLYKPKLEAGGRWLVPAPGFLDLCKRRYPRSVSEEPPDFTNSRQADYASEWAIQNEAPVALFAMRRDDRRLLAFDPRDVRQPVGMLRHALRRWVDENPSIQAHYGADRIARLLFGHRSASAAEPSAGGHFAVVPLASMNASFTADGWLRRLMLIGYGCKEAADHDLFEDVARGLHRAPLRDNGQGVATLQRLPTHLTEQVIAPWVSTPERPAKRWRTVTPIILTGFTRRGRSPEQCILRALTQQGFNLDDVESVAAFTGPIIPHVEPARAYRVRGYLSSTPRCHAEILFRHPVQGPLVVGRGRFAGFGLMMPWQP